VGGGGVKQVCHACCVPVRSSSAQLPAPERPTISGASMPIECPPYEVRQRANLLPSRRERCPVPSEDDEDMPVSVFCLSRLSRGETVAHGSGRPSQARVQKASLRGCHSVRVAFVPSARACVQFSCSIARHVGAPARGRQPEVVMENVQAGRCAPRQNLHRNQKSAYRVPAYMSRRQRRQLRIRERGRCLPLPEPPHPQPAKTAEMKRGGCSASARQVCRNVKRVRARVAGVCVAAAAGKAQA